MATKKDHRLNGLNPLSYIGVNAVAPSNTAEYNRAPTSNDRKNFDIGARWIDKSKDPPDLWALVKFEGAVATWINLSSFNTNGTDGQVLIGGGTEALWRNITTISGLVVVNEGTNTLDLDLSGTIADIFQTDTLFAQPSGGVLEIAGGSSITTSGSGNVVTIETGPDVATLFLGDVGFAIPLAGVLLLEGGANVTTNASGAVVTITATGGGGGGSANASFLAHQIANGGDPYAVGGGVKLGAAVVMTEVYDIGNNFTVGDGAGTAAKFTAPQDGKYLLQVQIKYNALAGASTTNTKYIEIQTSNRTYRKTITRTTTLGVLTPTEALSFDVIADMDSADTVEYYAYSSDIIATFTIGGDVAGTGEYETFVSGTLEENDITGFTEHAVLVGDSTSGIGELPLGTDGQVIIGKLGGSPLFANITAGANITINEGPNTLEIVSTGGGLGSSVASFLAVQVGNGGDATGGGIYLGAVIAMTEIYDVGGDFDGGDGAGTSAKFTAPQTGKYFMQANAWLQPAVIKVTSTTHFIYLETSNRTYADHESIELQAGVTARYSPTTDICAIVDMDLGDTLEVKVLTTGGTASSTVIGGSTTALSTFISGTLV